LAGRQRRKKNIVQTTGRKRARNIRVGRSYAGSLPTSTTCTGVPLFATDRSNSRSCQSKCNQLAAKRTQYSREIAARTVNSSRPMTDDLIVLSKSGQAEIPPTTRAAVHMARGDRCRSLTQRLGNAEHSDSFTIDGNGRSANDPAYDLAGNMTCDGTKSALEAAD
jgi:hypothetical protein